MTGVDVNRTLFQKSILCVLIAGVLGGCGAPTVTQHIAREQATARPQVDFGPAALQPTDSTMGSAQQAERMAAEQRNRPVIRRANRAWIGSAMVDVQNDESLPPIFYEPFNLNFDDRATDGRVSLQVVVERLSRITKVPVRVHSDVLALLAQRNSQQGPGGFGNTLSPTPGTIANRPGAAATAIPGLSQQLPAPNAPVVGTSSGPVQISQNAPVFDQPRGAPQNFTDLSSIEMRWDNRTLADFLNFMTDRLGLSWSYRDGVVTVQRFITETFEVSAFLSSQDFSMTLQGQSSGTSGGGATSSLGVNEAGKNEGLGSLLKALQAMVASSQGSLVTFNEGTGRVAVTTTKDMMSRVREVIRQEQESMQRQVLIQVDIYSLTSNLGDERGVNWTAVFQNLQNTLGLTLTSPASLTGSSAGALTLSVLSTANGGNPNSRLVQAFGNSSLMFQALAQSGVSVAHRPLNLVTLNRQWARKTNLRQTGYLAETTPSTVAGAGSGAPGLKTASVTTGDRFIVQPAILDNGSVLLKFAVSLTDLLSLFEVTTGSGATLQRVQTPEIAGVDDQATVRLRQGELMVLTGLSRIRSNANTNELIEGAGVGLGGSRKQSTVREDFIIFVRPVIL